MGPAIDVQVLLQAARNAEEAVRYWEGRSQLCARVAWITWAPGAGTWLAGSGVVTDGAVQTALFTWGAWAFPFFCTSFGYEVHARWKLRKAQKELLARIALIPPWAEGKVCDELHEILHRTHG